MNSPNLTLSGHFCTAKPLTFQRAPRLKFPCRKGNGLSRPCSLAQTRRPPKKPCLGQEHRVRLQSYSAQAFGGFHRLAICFYKWEGLRKKRKQDSPDCSPVEKLDFWAYPHYCFGTLVRSTPSLFYVNFVSCTGTSAEMCQRGRVEADSSHLEETAPLCIKYTKTIPTPTLNRIEVQWHGSCSWLESGYYLS